MTDKEFLINLLEIVKIDCRSDWMENDPNEAFKTLHDRIEEHLTMKSKKRLAPRIEKEVVHTGETIEKPHVTAKMIREFHGEEWTEKFWEAAGSGNTMYMVEEDGQKVGGIYMCDYERFADVVDYGKSTYFD